MTDPYQSYTATAAQTDFTIPFSFLRPEDVRVFVDGVEASWSLVSGSTARLEDAAAGGETVTIRRITGIDSPYATFTDVLTPINLNSTVLQLLYSLQEQDFTVGNLSLDVPDVDYIPPASAVDKMLVTQDDGMGGWEWAAVDIADVITAGGGAALPDPSALSDNVFLTVDDGEYVAISLAAAKALLTAGGISLPDPTGQPQQFCITNSLGSGYELVNAAGARSKLGLGTAAVKNAGNTPNNLLIVDDDTNYGGTPGNAALPSIQRGGLQGVPIEPEYYRVSAAPGAVGTNGDMLNGATVDETPDWSSPWAALWDDGGPVLGVEILTGGTYVFEVHCGYTSFGSTPFAMDLDLDDGASFSETITGLAMSTSWSIVRHTAVVPANTVVRVKNIGTSGRTNAVAQLHITRVA